jgi:uncharacterized protein (TIGR00730 family)
MSEQTEHLVTPEIDAAIKAIIDEAGIAYNKGLITSILETGVALGTDDTTRLDLKITSAAISEMREAFALFRPYADRPKVTVFGSARTMVDTTLYQHTRNLAAALAQRGWMIVTGAGPGIMQAAAEGAGPEMSLGVSIQLPFEEKPSDAAAESPRVEMKYFFTRKLMLVKESRGFVCMPGGFGTMDEMFELLTLQQTGKAEPQPIVLLDEPGGKFWAKLAEYVEKTMVPAGVISPDDLERVLITDSVDHAVEEILGFWRNYHSLRWVGDRLILRMQVAPSDSELEELNERFGGVVSNGPISRTQPHEHEVRGNDHLDLPRLVLTPEQRHIGSLHHLIRAINAINGDAAAS